MLLVYEIIVCSYTFAHSNMLVGSKVVSGHQAVSPEYCDYRGFPHAVHVCQKVVCAPTCTLCCVHLGYEYVLRALYSRLTRCDPQVARVVVALIICLRGRNAICK